MPTTSPNPAPLDRPAASVSWRVILFTAVGLAAAWAGDTFGLRTTLLVSRKGQPALTPLYAFWDPLLTFGAVAFVGIAASIVWFGPRCVDPARAIRRTFVAFLIAVACVVPLAAFAVRLPVTALGSQPILFEYGDFLQDAQRVESLGPFLRDYVAAMPTLSLHAQHYPPGPIVALHLWSGVFGSSPFAAGVLVLLAFAVGVWLSYRALAEFASERAARQGALLIACAPMALDQACTSMDAVFMAIAAGVWWWSLRVFRPGAGSVSAAGLGVLLFTATCFSFSALPLGLAVLAFAILLVRERGGQAVRLLVQLAVVGVAYLAAAWILGALSGFSILDCFLEAREHAAKFMGRIIRGTPRATWGYRTYGNIVAFAVGSGLAIVPAVVVRLHFRPRFADVWPRAAALTLAVMAFAPIYYMETERIWLFALPWVAAIAVGRAGFDEASSRRLLVAALVQALFMQSLLFTYW